MKIYSRFTTNELLNYSVGMSMREDVMLDTSRQLIGSHSHVLKKHICTFLSKCSRACRQSPACGYSCHLLPVEATISTSLG